MAFDYAAKIRALLARANHPNTPQAEADEARKMAESWMIKYRVEESEALAENPLAVEPEKLITVLDVYTYELAHHVPEIVRACSIHAEVKVRQRWLSWSAGGRTLELTVVGYAGDLRYFELLLTSAYLMFTTKIAPTWDPSRTDADNVYLMRQAGIKRREIADAAGWDGNNAAARSRVQRMYLAAASRLGEAATVSGLGFDSKGYRQAYAEQFVTTLNSEMRRARMAAATGVPAIFNRAEKVTEAFYAHCPDMRPSTEVSPPYVAPNADCGRCKAAASGFCRSHNWLKPRTVTKADEARWMREQYSSSRTAGRAAGRQAAQGVVVKRGSTDHAPAPKLERSHSALES